MTNFEKTLDLIQQRLSNSLLPNYNKIWVQGYNSPKVTKLVFTIFNKESYQMKFVDINNFRQFKQENVEKNESIELEVINTHVYSFRTLLQEYINFGD